MWMSTQAKSMCYTDNVALATLVLLQLGHRQVCAVQHTYPPTLPLLCVHSIMPSGIHQGIPHA